MRPASYVPGELIPLPLSGSIRNYPMLKNSKIAGSENLANVAYWRFKPLQGSVESIREPAIVLAAIYVVPQLAARDTHQRS